MSDDLGDILQSALKTISKLNDRVETLEAQSRASGNQDWGAPSTMGWVHPTSPPSTLVTVERGLYWAYYINSYTCLTEITPYGWQTQNVEVSGAVFTSPYYFQFCILLYYPGGFVFHWGAADGFYEAETYEECLADLEYSLTNGMLSMGSVDPYIPLCALIVRDDNAGGVMPVTLHDRSQSSIAIRDLRPWFTAMYGDCS
jgi:hypothetical protein